MKEKKNWDSSIFDDSDMYILYMRIHVLQFKSKKKHHKKRLVYENQVIKCIFILINFANFTNNIRTNKITNYKNTYHIQVC